MYTALVCKLKNVRSHPNADKLQLATVEGYTIIVGLDNTENQLGVFFGPEGKLSSEHLFNNNLYNNSALNIDVTKKGYFSSNGKVKPQKLRGIISEGFWQPIESFVWAGNFPYKEKDTFSQINGHLICEKYYSPATLKLLNQDKKVNTRNLWVRWRKFPIQKKFIKFFPYLGLWIKEFFIVKKIKDTSLLKEHYDTQQLRQHLREIPKDALIYISYKLHGTSGRTGRILTNQIYTGFLSKIRNKLIKPSYQYISGSRRVILKTDEKDYYYTDSQFRKIIHDYIQEKGLYKGECLYYEIVGYSDKLTPFMGTYKTEDKEISKLYGKNIIFSYGCKPVTTNLLGNCFKIFVYRITMVNEDGTVIEYSWPQIIKRCKELDLTPVPEVDRVIFSTPDKLLASLQPYIDGPDTLDSSHPREGLVLRIEHSDYFTALKIKGATFCLLEDIRNSDDLFVDLEDIS